MTDKPLISIVSPCYNEEDNVDELFRRVIAAVAGLLPKYDFEYIFIDNNSTDRTQEKLRALAAADKRVKVILNARNFGHIRSPYYGILQSRGVATIYLASDLQDPPELIPEFVRHWEAGAKLVLAIKPVSEGSPIVHNLRQLYYRTLDSISDVHILKDSTGFGLYSRDVLNHVRKVDDPYPFLRGLIAEIGFDVVTVPFVQPRRLRGISKNNVYTLYDIAWLGIVSHSKVPIRMAAFVGFAVGLLSGVVALVFVVLKLIFWESFPIGVSPLIIGMFGLFGLQFMFIGILGEYVGAILTYVQKRPVVVERERINFD
ncbi:MAG: glycosyltransferase family 2 protein [Bradyrhizobium sp.]|nr:glycosyltransferase family 2 protein [Bradyrhizobium sp.]